MACAEQWEWKRLETSRPEATSGFVEGLPPVKLYVVWFGLVWFGFVSFRFVWFGAIPYWMVWIDGFLSLESPSDP